MLSKVEVKLEAKTQIVLSPLDVSGDHSLRKHLVHSGQNELLTLMRSTFLRAIEPLDDVTGKNLLAPVTDHHPNEVVWPVLVAIFAELKLLFEERLHLTAGTAVHDFSFLYILTAKTNHPPVGLD